MIAKTFRWVILLLFVIGGAFVTHVQAQPVQPIRPQADAGAFCPAPAPEKGVLLKPAPPAYGRGDRYAAVRPNWESVWRQQWNDQCCQPKQVVDDVDGLPNRPAVPAKKCPLCEDSPKTPCGECRMCEAGFPCERTLCRHCVQPRSMFMCNFCDLSAGDEPCGTCDACREHRSDPCAHADDGHGPGGEFNPYHEPTFGAILPRVIVDWYNNGARKFPVYYNPAPYYRPHWNPSLFAGYARPFTFRWSCPLCFKDPCECANPPYAGQVPFAYSCKFCNRNPCACAGSICNVTKPMNPKGTSAALAEMNKDSTRVQDTHDEANIERRKSRENKPRLIDVDDDSLPTNLRESTPKKSTEPEERKSPKLDGPESNGAPQRPGAVGRVS